MKAGSNGTAHLAPLTYDQCDWGDLICGTKDQVQELGIGLGCAFPGEPGGPRRGLKTQDQRGYSAEIAERWGDAGRFTCRLKFPHWPAHPGLLSSWCSFAPGVRKRLLRYADEYVGSPEDLAAAGLVRLDQLPGQPGMRKFRVTILPDGSLPTGAPTARNRGARLPGARSIERASASSYSVAVNVTAEETERRDASYRAVQSAWQQQVRALPRPARLQPISPGALANASIKHSAPQNAAAPLFGDTPSTPQEQLAYQKHVFKSLKDLVDFTQTSAY